MGLRAHPFPADQDHLLSGPGPVAGEKPLPAADGIDAPAPRTPRPSSLKASLPEIWLQFASSTLGMRAPALEAVRVVRGCEALGVKTV